MKNLLVVLSVVVVVFFLSSCVKKDDIIEKKVVSLSVRLSSVSPASGNLGVSKTQKTRDVTLIGIDVKSNGGNSTLEKTRININGTAAVTGLGIGSAYQNFSEFGISSLGTIINNGILDSNNGVINYNNFQNTVLPEDTWVTLTFKISISANVTGTVFASITPSGFEARDMNGDIVPVLNSTTVLNSGIMNLVLGD